LIDWSNWAIGLEYTKCGWRVCSRPAFRLFVWVLCYCFFFSVFSHLCCSFSPSALVANIDTSELSMGWVDPSTHGLGRDFSLFGGLGWVGSTTAKALKIWKHYVNTFKARLDKIWLQQAVKSVRCIGLGRVGSIFSTCSGLGWVSQLMDWVGSGHTKWTRGQLWDTYCVVGWFLQRASCWYTWTSIGWRSPCTFCTETVEPGSTPSPRHR